MDIDIYKTAKALHIIFFTTWMAGLFYLPRLFVYHCQVKTKTQEYKRFVIMEKKLLNYIMNPIIHTNLDNRRYTCYKYRASSMVKYKNYLYCFNECFSHVLCKNKKDI